MRPKTYLYRAYSDQDELCYVGITKNFDLRLRTHITDKPWWTTEVSYINVRIYFTREEAAFEESKAIAEELPKYNQVPGKRYPNGSAPTVLSDRFTPAKTRLALPAAEVEYLKTLEEPFIYERAAVLQEAGWAVSQIIKAVKVSPSPVQLRVAIKLTRARDTSMPVPLPPLTKTEERDARIAAAVHLTEAESLRLIELSKQVKKYRPGHAPGHPIYQAKEDYNYLITRLYISGVTALEMSEAVGVDASNIRRRIQHTPL